MQIDESPPFIPGRELSRLFYFEAVRPILERRFPGLAHAAARIGWGSDVLGFDTEMSADHGWGPTVTLFLREQDARHEQEIHAVMARELPPTIHGIPVHSGDASDPGHHHPVLKTEPPLNHRVF